MSRRHRLHLACLSLLAAALPARAAPDPAIAAYVFQQAREICQADAGQLWGRSLCGPIMIVDPRDRGMVANQADAEGVLSPTGEVHAGTLPAGVMVANTAIDWAGERWTQLMWPVSADPDMLRAMVVHELFHRIQPELGLRVPEGDNAHLDTLEGRYLLQMEWRALARALMALDAQARRGHVADALAFRQERRRLFPKAAAAENALELNEGLAEYTGARLGLRLPEQRLAYATYALARQLDAPSFVRSFAYASGPAYGLLLDEALPDWRRGLGGDTDLGALLAQAWRIGPARPGEVATRSRRYDPDGSLRLAEERRDAERQARLAAWRASLVDGPVIVLPLKRTRMQMNPQTLVPLDDIGTVYPVLRLADEWGELVVEGGAALVANAPRRAVVAVPRGGDLLAGDGWTLHLAPGWKLVPGERQGDWTLKQEAAP